MTPERRLLLGRVIGAFGVRGELKLQSFTDPIAGVLDYQPWLFVHNGVEREISGARGRVTAKGLTITLPDLTDRDAADALAGAEVWVPRSRLPAPKPGEYYWVDLEGMAVVNLEGVAFGTVSHLFETAANDVVVVTGERQRLIPFLLDRYILSIDFDTGTITVDWDADF